MRRSILLIAIATGASLAAAQDQNNIFIPPSSIEKAGEIGIRAHTHYYMRVPDPNITPDSAPPGITVETPGSIGCIYNLVFITRLRMSGRDRHGSPGRRHSDDRHRGRL